MRLTTEQVCGLDGSRASGDSQSEVQDGWRKVYIILDSGPTFYVVPEEVLEEANAAPFTGARANKTLYAANATQIKVTREKKFKALTDERFPLDLTSMTGAVKKALKSTAITCDEGGRHGQWVIHTK